MEGRIDLLTPAGVVVDMEHSMLRRAGNRSVMLLKRANTCGNKPGKVYGYFPVQELAHLVGVYGFQPHLILPIHRSAPGLVSGGTIHVYVVDGVQAPRTFNEGVDSRLCLACERGQSLWSVQVRYRARRGSWDTAHRFWQASAYANSIRLGSEYNWYAESLPDAWFVAPVPAYQRYSEDGEGGSSWRSGGGVEFWSQEDTEIFSVDTSLLSAREKWLPPLVERLSRLIRETESVQTA